MTESIVSSTPELCWGRRRQGTFFPVCCSDGREQPMCPTVPRHPLEENGNTNIVDLYRVIEKSLCFSQKCCTDYIGGGGERTGSRGSCPEGEAKIELADGRVELDMLSRHNTLSTPAP